MPADAPRADVADARRVSLRDLLEELAVLGLTLTEKQTAALKQRFGGAVDVDLEIANATAYATDIHRGRPYANFGKFVWNWCARAETWGKPKMRPANRTTRPAAPAEFTRAELEAALEDEMPEVRERAAELLKVLDAGDGVAQDQ